MRDQAAVCGNQRACRSCPLTQRMSDLMLTPMALPRFSNPASSRAPGYARADRVGI
jgi:hypothetical protein